MQRKESDPVTSNTLITNLTHLSEKKILKLHIKSMNPTRGNVHEMKWFYLLLFVKMVDKK